MLKRTIQYQDWNDTQRTEDFFFNLTETECLDLQLTTAGGLAETIQKIINSNEVAQMIGVFKELLLASYGEKSDDGRHFVKSPEIRASFQNTVVFNKLYLELATDDKAAVAFIEGIMPANLLEQAKAEQAKNADNLVAIPQQ